MTVRDILVLVCEFVGEKELYVKLKSNLGLSEREQEKIDCMVDCFNLVRQEIASDYLPFLTKEEISVENSILHFSNLSKVLINVYQVKNWLGINLRFKIFPDFVEISGKAKTILYSYLPEDASLDDEVEVQNGLTARVFAYGVASEFLLVDGLGEDAEVWEERFKESLFILGRKRGSHIMPKRNWR